MVLYEINIATPNAYVRDREKKLVMKNRLFKLLIVFLLVVFVSTLFVACHNDALDEDVTKALNEYFNGGRYTIEHVFGEYNSATVVLVKSKHVINTLRKDTINGLEFDYARRTVLLAVKDGMVYTMRDAFLNLVTNTSMLTAIHTAYTSTVKLDSSAQYKEIVSEVVLENKLSMEDLGYVFNGTDLFYVEENGEETPVEYYDDRVVLTVDKNFNNHYFTFWDFSMMNYSRIDFLTEYAHDLYKGKFPDDFHHVIVIELKNVGKESVLRAIETLSKLDFVMSAQVRVYKTITD